MTAANIPAVTLAYTLPVPSAAEALPQPRILPLIPWRDPHTVSPADLADYIQKLQQACELQPRNADLRTCLGMAYAMNYEVYKSLDALEAAVALEPDNFYAQYKKAELWYRLRALHRAQEDTMRALNLAANGFELSLARKQLQEIRRLMRDGTQKPEWNKSLIGPAVLLVIMLAVISFSMLAR
jgi:cytochrome c-type biogenesis protein CcmH/NrfG